MTSERAEAYGRLKEEQIREAADALLFCNGDWGDEQTLEALVHVGRWREEPAQLLLRELRACGPLAAV